MSVYEDMTPPPALNRIWRGTVAADVADFADKMYVIMPDFDPHLKIGPARWQARDAVSLPAKGDDCLVIFDNDREPWVPVWWPF